MSIELTNVLQAAVSEISPNAVGLIFHVTERMDGKGIENIRKSLAVFVEKIKEHHGVVLPVAVIGDGVKVIEIIKRTDE
jgi:hypothetical protein